MLDFTRKECYNIADFRKIIELLRSENGCPWDREQTHESIRRNFIEEVYEVCEAIDEADTEHLKEELGDVLMQVIFHARIEEEIGSFDLDDVADMACKKLIYRHPHVFADVEVTGTENVLDNWEELKRAEKSQKTNADAVNSVAKSLPALWRAEKIQKKASKAGFEFASMRDALAKLKEEVAELEEAIESGVKADIEAELGDVLFATVKVGRFEKVDPEDALGLSCDKFSDRFAAVEQSILAQGKTMESSSREELIEQYNIVKTQEKTV